jgi:hypothetical protein
MRYLKLLNPQTIGDIAFDVNKKSGYTLYIKENSKFVPYLVLTSNYNEQALLLRKDLLNDCHTYNDETYGYSGYYRDSTIDKFLNQDFLTTVDAKIQSDIVDSEITITAKSSMAITGEDTESITRKVFLISATEIGMGWVATTTKEGKPLKYFKDSKSRIAYMGQKATCWWLRSPSTWDASSVFGISPDGTFGDGGLSTIDTSIKSSKSGVRPAFCIRNTQAIEKSDNIIQGQTVYVIVEK